MAAIGWRSAWKTTETKGATETSAAAANLSIEKLFDTIIEVIDPKAGKVITRTRLNQLVVAVLPGQRMVSYRVNKYGGDELIVDRFALETKKGKR